MDGRRDEPPGRRGRAAEFCLALVLTVASTLLWGVAHLWAGRRVAGFLLMSVFAMLLAGAGVATLVLRGHLAQFVVAHTWLEGITLGVLALALLWTAVVVRSYLVVAPTGLPAGARVTAGVVVMTLTMAVCGPLLWTARDAYVLRSTLTGIFASHSVDSHDPLRDRRRLNVLLLGGDGAPDRAGVRTDSITMASVDTSTGDTVLLGLPRNLQYFAMPPRLSPRFPYGYTGFGGGDQGLINELYQNAESRPSLEPGYGPGQRGPRLMEETVGNLLGVKIDYYIVVNMSGFADIVDAMGGLRMHVTSRLPIGGDSTRPPSGYLEPGYRTLSGRDALWYGRSRHADSDYARMGRQKCLLRAMAQQADPTRVLARIEQIATAAKRTISTDIPAELLPALVKLARKAKHGAAIHSLMFVPPRFSVVRPDINLMRATVAQAIAAGNRSADAGSARHGPAHERSETNPSPEARAPHRAVPHGGSGPAAAPSGKAGAPSGGLADPSRPVSLDEACR